MNTYIQGILDKIKADDRLSRGELKDLAVHIRRQERELARLRKIEALAQEAVDLWSDDAAPTSYDKPMYALAEIL